MKVTKDQLTNKPENRRRHVVIIGAGASVQAFPEGDANGLRLPTMDNFIETLSLQTILENAGVEHEGLNFETIYSKLHIKNPDSTSINKINKRVYEYFNSLQLPKQPTLYDHLVLSLRPKDLIASFNWDPFLYDAWNRNEHLVPLPKIAYLHGNVRMGYCLKHKLKGENGLLCPECDKVLTPSQLLYPVTKKNYSKNPFIESEWKLLDYCLRQAATLTIIGYGAPNTDREAVDMIENAWDKKNRLIERTEVIDIKDRELLWKQWSPYIVETYFDCYKDFYQSRIPNYPRRTCEALLDMTFYGFFVDKNPLPADANFSELMSWMKPLIEAERAMGADTVQKS